MKDEVSYPDVDRRNDAIIDRKKEADAERRRWRRRDDPQKIRDIQRPRQ